MTSNSGNTADHNAGRRRAESQQSEMEHSIIEARLAYSICDYPRVLEILSGWTSAPKSTRHLPAEGYSQLSILAAWSAYGLGRLRDARGYLVKSLEISPQDEILKAHASVLAAAIEREKGNYFADMEQLVALRRRFAATAEHDLYGELSRVVGIALKWVGDLDGSLECFQAAVAAFRRSDNAAGEARALNNLSLVLRSMGHLSLSRKFLLEAKGVQSRIRSSRFHLNYLINMAVLDYACGNWSSSHGYASEALMVVEALSLPLWRTRGLLCRGRSLISLGDFEHADRDLAEAQKGAMEHGFAREQALAHEFLGDLARARGDWPTARKEWAAALAIGERIAPRGDVTGEPLRRMAEAALHEENIAEALTFARRAYSVNTSCGDRKERASTLRVLGDIARVRGRLIAARLAYGASVGELRTMGALGELAESERALREMGESVSAAESPLDAPPRLPDESLRAPDESYKAAFRLREMQADFFTQDPVLGHIVERLRVVSRSSGTVLVHGETGTGKELLARFVHEASGRKGPFIAVNASAFPEALVESELFGHIRGAFTGAVGDRKGLLEVAHGGTFFLDEIGELPPTLQSKLLRTLEEKAVRRIGSAELRKLDVRFVAATNRDLREEVASGRFRTDLYHRFAIHEFEVPPLRRRVGDIAVLARHFLIEALGEWSKRFGGFEAEALDALRLYPWPGNVRELANEMQRVASVVGDAEPVAFHHLSGRVRAASGSGAGEGLFEEMALRERTRIEEALEATGGNQSRAGALLGLSRQALRYKILKYGIPVHKEPPDRPLKNNPKR